MMEYKGYFGKVEFDDEAEVFHGEVVNTRDVITFQGQSVAELTQAFRESIEDYLEFCAQRGEVPEKPCSGRFVTRISPELHRRIQHAASSSGDSLNAWVKARLEAAISPHPGGGGETVPKRTPQKKKSRRPASGYFARRFAKRPKSAPPRRGSESR